MLAEFRRVLTPDGVLVISSPNRPVYNEAGQVENHFHVRELDRAELKALLDPAFPQQAWYAQRVVAQSALWAEERAAAAKRAILALADRPSPCRRAVPAPPMYFVVSVRRRARRCPSLPALSLFDDGALSLWRDYARALTRERQLAWDELDARAIAEERLAELVPAVNALASDDSGRPGRASKDRRIAALRRRRVAQAELCRGEAQRRTRATRARLAYRESARGWLRLPLLRC